MDYSKKLGQIQSEQNKISNKLSVFAGLDTYSGEDKVVEFKELLRESGVNGKTESLKTGLTRLDEITGGLRQGQLIVVSGPTGMGKTSLLQSLTKEFSGKDIPCLWFSYEMPPLELGERFGADVPIFYTPAKNKDSNLEWLETRCLEGMAKFGTQIVFIDHLHFLLDMKFLAKTNTSIAIGMLMRELKKFALEYGLIIFLVAHLTKTNLMKGELPTIDDLRDSSFIGQESDFVWIIWRCWEKNIDSPIGIIYTNESKLVIAKNRWNGKLDNIKLIFNNGKFSEYNLC